MRTVGVPSAEPLVSRVASAPLTASLSSPDVIYVSAAGSMLCQIVNSLLLLPVSVARPLLSHLLDLLPPLDRLNRLLPAACPLEDQELQWPLHGEQISPQVDKPAWSPSAVGALNRSDVSVSRYLRLR